MLAISYHFHVLPRHRDPFRHAYQAAAESLRQTLGLLSHELHDPRERNEAFSLSLAWDSEASFIRFTRTWLGVWMLNGMGLDRTASSAAIETDVGEPGTFPQAKCWRSRMVPDLRKKTALQHRHREDA
jgi:hypothetical protein